MTPELAADLLDGPPNILGHGSGGYEPQPQASAIGATSPFVQASLNDRLRHAYSPFVRGGRGFGLACAIVVMEGEAITYASKGPTSGPVTGIQAASLPDFLRNRMHDEARTSVPAAVVADLPDHPYE